METTEKVSFMGTRSNLNITDIDCNDRDTQLCTVYANDIHNNLRVAEVRDVDYCSSYLLSFSIFRMAFLLMVSVNKGKKSDIALIEFTIQGSYICLAYM